MESAAGLPGLLRASPQQPRPVAEARQVPRGFVEQRVAWHRGTTEEDRTRVGTHCPVFWSQIL